MCQSKSSGGRRCNGRSRSAASGGSAVAVAEPRQVQNPNVPTREQADQLGASLPADRKGWDGQPLNEKDRRLFALRESGYKGPIDQDGYPATTGEAADALRYMAAQRGESVNW